VSDTKPTDDEVRELIVSLLMFVVEAKAPLDKKTKALDTIDKLRARLLS